MKNNLLNIFIKERLDDQLIRLFNTPHIGAIAQSVEQRIENPCVGSSILPHATIFEKPHILYGAFFMLIKNDEYSKRAKSEVFINIQILI